MQEGEGKEERRRRWREGEEELGEEGGKGWRREVAGAGRA